jgi:hypothetical protein
LKSVLPLSLLSQDDSGLVVRRNSASVSDGSDDGSDVPLTSTTHSLLDRVLVLVSLERERDYSSMKITR